MQNLLFGQTGDDKPKTVLCLGAHSDDIEIGCGGSILRILEEYPGCIVWWVVFSGNEARKDEALRSANLFLSSACERKIILNEYRDSYFPYQGAIIKDFFESLKIQVFPDLIFTHYRNDLNQDHRLINELTWNTWRNHLILEYEIPKYDGDLGNPNFYIPLTQQLGETKNKYLCEVFKTQEIRPWFTSDTFWSLLRLRGIECRAQANLAEAFYARKIVF